VWAILGLGNHKREYLQTRHNAGYMMVEELLTRTGRKFPFRLLGGKSYQATRAETESIDFIIARNRTYMNLCGIAAQQLLRHYPIEIDELVVVVDDINLPLGAIRLRSSGGDGGHRGLRSIINALERDDFPRLRLGIGRPPQNVDPASYVLSPFKNAERKVLAEMIADAGDCIEMVVTQGLEKAGSHFNQRG
jgi:PTH1 family peptidyl-tRNA hydrolase